ncbi:helix-turn-helix domain-containing protein [Sorangium sp. So ce385]|uniref:helix-turn-helix domain-containing protein n=1 Tax=Sorangium sp. So ce385 TaxID=3133308 RepID=UPI003F5BF407
MAGVREKLLTASDLAALCEVDLKTIHNWVDRGRIAHFRTPGRHLRFKAADVAEFLRAWGYSVPRELAKATSKSMMAIGTKDTMAHVARALGEGVPIRHASHPYDALIYAGADPADVYIIDVRAVSGDVDVTSLFEALHRANSQGTFVALSDEPISLPQFVGRIGRNDAQQLRAFLMPEAAAQPGAPLQASAGAASEEPPRSLAAGGSSR